MSDDILSLFVKETRVIFYFRLTGNHVSLKDFFLFFTPVSPNPMKLIEVSGLILQLL